MTPTFQDEVQLAGWSETHTGGAKVTFWLPTAEALDVFRTLTARKGNQAGHRFACVLVEIGDDEKPVQPITEPAITPDKPKGGEWAKQAGIWCNDPDFWMWANRYAQRPLGIGLITRPEEAAEFIRTACIITSRAELDNSEAALRRFNEQIRWPFMKFMQMRGIRKAAP